MPNIFMEKEFFAVYGVLGGVLLTLLGSWLLKRHEYKLRLWDKLIDRKINAHDNVIRSSQEMRKTSPIGGRNEDNQIRRIPHVLQSREVFDDFFTNFTTETLSDSSWLTLATRKELNFIQDYLVNVHEQIALLSDADLEVLAETVHFDFIELSSSLEKVAYSFYEKEVLQLKIGNLKDWHKYDLDITLKRLGQTRLYLNYIAPLK